MFTESSQLRCLSRIAPLQAYFATTSSILPDVCGLAMSIRSIHEFDFHFP